MAWSHKNIRILTVEANSTKRQFLNKELRARGYDDVTGVSSARDGIDLLKKEIFDWAMFPLSETADPSALAVQEYVLRTPRLQNLEISFILHDDIGQLSDYIKKGFDMGLFSYFENFNNQKELADEFKKLFDLIEIYDGYGPFISAAYLRTTLLRTGNYPELISLEKNINKLTCRFPRAILHLAEAHCLCNENHKAAPLLRQAPLLDPTLTEAAKALFAKYNIEASQDADTTVNILGLNKVVIIEPDPEVTTKIREFLSAIGVTGVKEFAAAADAVDWLRNNRDTELIFFEWQQNDIPGPILGQKIRAFGSNAPLIVINHNLDTEDLPILKEMGMTHFLKKPLEKASFYSEVFWVVSQDRAPTEPHTILQKLRQAQQDKDLTLVANLKKTYFAHKRVTEVDKLFVNAEISYEAGFFHKAKQYAAEAVECGGDSLELLSLLGKTLMQLREFETALRCLENAQVISPTNIKRMCTIAEAHMELEDDSKFNDSLNKAKQLDEDNPHIHVIEAKNAIKHAEHDKARELMMRLDSLKDIVKFTNNRAVALIRTDHYDEGITLYNDAIKSIPEHETEILATLYYNLGLAQARRNELAEAVKVLKIGESQRSLKLIKKLVSLRQRAEKALIQGRHLNLKANAPLSLASESADAEKYMKDLDILLQSLEREPGSYNLHMTYVYPKSEERQIASMLKAKVS